MWAVPLHKKVRFHDLRHTTASLLTIAGASPAAVQKILRHADVRTTTETYTHLDDDFLRSEHNRLKLPDPKPKWLDRFVECSSSCGTRSTASRKKRRSTHSSVRARRLAS